MNIDDIITGLTKYSQETITEDIEDNKRKLDIYKKAYEALEELQDILEEGIDPATGRLSKQTELFYDKLTEMINEIHSRSLAFEE